MGFVDSETMIEFKNKIVEKVEKIVLNFAEEYDETKLYYVDDLVIFKDELYQCLLDQSVVADPTHDTDWKQITINEAVLGLINEEM